jgi:hypothetical protein
VEVEIFLQEKPTGTTKQKAEKRKKPKPEEQACHTSQSVAEIGTQSI